MNWRKAVMFVCVFTSYAEGSDFVVTKKAKRPPSLSTCKQECCEQCGALVKAVPPLLSAIADNKAYIQGDQVRTLLKAVADLQDASLSCLEGYWLSDRSTFCMRASRAELVLSTQHLSQAVEALECLKSEIARVQQGAISSTNGFNERVQAIVGAKDGLKLLMTKK